MDENLVEVDQLCFAYGESKILNSISLTVKEEQFLTILGPNGSGKTTLLKSIAGILPTKTGAIRINQKPFEA